MSVPDEVRRAVVASLQEQAERVKRDAYTRVPRRLRAASSSTPPLRVPPERVDLPPEIKG